MVCTETCKKYSVTVIFFYIFHIKPHFFKTLFQSQFLFDFDEICTNKSENVCSFCDYFIIFFESIDFKYSRFKHKLKLYVFKSTFIVLSSWRSEFCFVLNMWTLLKSLDNKIMLKSQCKTTFKHVFVCKNFIKIGQEFTCFEK
jgi:hypothetical protein